MAALELLAVGVSLAVGGLALAALARAILAGAAARGGGR